MRSIAFGITVCAMAVAFLGAGRLARAAEGDLVLTKTEPASAAIVVPDNANAAVKGFAALLQKRLQQSLDRKVPIQSEAAAGQAQLAFQVGPTAASLKQVPEQAQLKPHDFIVRFDGKSNVFLAAKDEYAIGYAVVEFADKVMNCRQYMPAPLGECITKTDKLVIPAGLNLRLNPDLASVFFSGVAVPGRESYLTPYKEMEVAFQLYKSDEFHHNLFNIFPAAKYGQTHPEYYPEVDGKRLVPGAPGSTVGWNSGWQPCFSNPEVFQITLDYALNWFKDHPSATSVSIALNDGGGWCQCAQCKAERERLGGYGNEFYDFANRLARELQKRAPGKMIGLSAYGFATEAPTFALEKNVLVYRVHPDEHGLAPWAEKGAATGAYTWLYGTGYVTPRYFPHEFQKRLKLWESQGALGLYAETYPNWIVDAPMLYVVSKMARHIDVDINALLEQYSSDMFGPAAPQIVKFYTVAERAMGRRNSQRFDDFSAMSACQRPLRYQFDCWRIEDVEEMDQALAAAPKLPDGSLEAQRLAMLKTWWNWSREYILVYKNAEGVAQMPLASPAEIEAAVPFIEKVPTELDSLDTQWVSTFRDIGKDAQSVKTGLYYRNVLDPNSYDRETLNWVEPAVWAVKDLDDALLAANARLVEKLGREKTVALWSGLATQHPKAAPYLISQATIAKGDLPNLVSNSSMEEVDTFEKTQPAPLGFIYWQSASSWGPIGLDDTVAHTGKCSVHIGAPGNAWLSRTFTVKPDGRYLVSVWVRGTGPAVRAAVTAVFLDKAGPIKRIIKNVLPEGEAVLKWYQIEMIVSVPPRCDKMTVDMSGESTWWDDLSVARLD